MAKRTQSKERRMAMKRAAKRARQEHPGGMSRYARKVAWLHKYGNGRWGFQIGNPKPWLAVKD